jgi:hypothetical protein
MSKRPIETMDSDTFDPPIMTLEEMEREFVGLVGLGVGRSTQKISTTLLSLRRKKMKEKLSTYENSYPR